MKKKKLIALLLTSAMVVSMAACGGKADNAAQPAADDKTSAPAESVEDAIANAGVQKPNQETGNTETTDETLIVALTSLPDFLWSPGMAQQGVNEEQIINAALLDRLVDLDENTNEVKPMLAESWEWVDEDSLQFNLREDVVMSDGTPLVADDVVYTAKVWKDNCASNDTGMYIDSAEAVDEHTVIINYNLVAPDIVKLMTWANFGIVSEDEVNALGGLEAAAMNPVMGSGRYKFKEWKSGEYVLLERNDNYWDDSYKGYYKEIKIIAINDSGAKASAVMSGDAQVAYDMPVNQAATFTSNDSLRTYIYSGQQVEHLWFNMREDHPTSDIRVRQAIAKAINYDALAQVATAGFGGKCYSYVNENAKYYEANYTDADFAMDIEGAKALLAEAGYDENNRLQLCTYTLPDQVDAYTVIQQNLNEINVDFEINNVDMGAFVPALLLEKSYDITLVGSDSSARTPDMPCFVREGMSFGGPAVVLPEFEELINNIVKAQSDEEAKGILKEYDNKAKEEMLCMNCYELVKSSLVGKDIKGFALRERAYVDITTLYK